MELVDLLSMKINYLLSLLYFILAFVLDFLKNRMIVPDNEN